jgi:monomeric isocitrate dehydrogenase
LSRASKDYVERFDTSIDQMISKKKPQVKNFFKLNPHKLRHHSSSKKRNSMGSKNNLFFNNEEEEEALDDQSAKEEFITSDVAIEISQNNSQLPEGIHSP